MAWMNIYIINLNAFIVFQLITVVQGIVWTMPLARRTWLMGLWPANALLVLWVKHAALVSDQEKISEKCSIVTSPQASVIYFLWYLFSWVTRSTTNTYNPAHQNHFRVCVSLSNPWIDKVDKRTGCSYPAHANWYIYILTQRVHKNA